jgi:hypothetical protein
MFMSMSILLFVFHVHGLSFVPPSFSPSLPSICPILSPICSPSVSFPVFFPLSSLDPFPPVSPPLSLLSVYSSPSLLGLSHFVCFHRFFSPLIASAENIRKIPFNCSEFLGIEITSLKFPPSTGCQKVITFMNFIHTLAWLDGKEYLKKVATHLTLI